MKRQQGVTLGGMFFFLILIGFGLYMAMRILPAYTDYLLINRTLDHLASQSGIQDIHEDDLRDQFDKEMRLNNVKDVSRTDLLIERVPGGVKMSASFSVKRPFIGPVNFCMDFHAAAATGQ